MGRECSIQVIKKKNPTKKTPFPFLLNQLRISQEILQRQQHSFHSYFWYQQEIKRAATVWKKINVLQKEVKS